MGDLQHLYNGLATRVTALEKTVAKADRTVERLAENTARLATSVTKIESDVGWLKDFLRYSVAAAIVWLGALTFYGIGLIKDVSGLRGKGGSYQATEEALQNSKTPEEVGANLDLLVAQVQKRASVGQPLNQAQLDTVADVISGSTKSFPELPRVWDAAATVINARYSINSPSVAENLSDCLDTIVPGQERERFTGPDGARFEKPGFIEAPAQIPWRAHAIVKNCILDLDSSPKFEDSSVGRFFANEKAHHPNTVALFIEVSNAKIIYSGGPMLPVSGIHFTNCVFELRRAATTPPPQGRRLAGHLLTADVTSDTITLAG